MAAVLGWRPDWLDRLKAGREPIEDIDDDVADQLGVDWDALRRIDPEFADAISHLARLALQRARTPAPPDRR
jgi:hypothetical protein